MRTKIVQGILVKTELGDIYFCPESVGKDPAPYVARVSEGLRTNLFIKCEDALGRQHFVSATHIVEMYVGDWTVKENENNKE